MSREEKLASRYVVVVHLIRGPCSHKCFESLQSAI